MALILLDEQAAFGVDAAEEDQVGIGRLDLGDHRGIVLLPLGDPFKGNDLDARTQVLFELLGKPLTVGGLVMDNGDFFHLQLLHGKVGGRFPLLVVPAADPENVVKALIGQLRVGGGMGNLRDSGLVVDFGCRDRAAAVEMARPHRQPLRR